MGSSALSCSAKTSPWLSSTQRRTKVGDRIIQGGLSVAGVVVDHALLGRAAPAALELDLDEVEVAVDVAAAANLEAPAFALGVPAVGEEALGCHKSMVR